mgnify:CR=1 FL=1
MKLVLSLVVLLFLAGCSKKEDQKPTPTSSMTHAEAMDAARSWAFRKIESRSYSAVAPTGSMLPVMGSNCVLLLERCKPEDLQIGDIAIYGRDGQSSVVHRIRELSPTAAFFTGDNNDPTKPDGWIAYGRIEWRVAGVLYGKR